MTTSRAAKLIPLAEVARPHGVRGELRLKVYNQDSDLLVSAREVTLRMPDGQTRPARLRTVRRANDALLAFLEGCEDRDGADALRGAQLCLSRDAFPPLPDDEFYACDIVGARLVAPDGDVGVVEELVPYPTCDVLVVATPRGRIDVPLVEDVVELVDVAAGIVRVHSREVLEPA